MAATKLIKAAVVALATGAVAFTGCGVSGGTVTQAGGVKPEAVEAGSFDGARGATFLKEAASSTAAVTTMREHMTVSTTGAGIDLSLTADGEYDAAARRGHFTLAAPELSAAGDLEMVLDGDTIYMKIPMLAGGGKPWMKLSSEELGQAGASSAAGNPGAFLKMLEGTGATITTVGKQDVRGVSTTHISTVLDLRKLLSEAAGPDKADLQAKLDSLGGAAFPDVPADAWIDDDGYVRKISIDMDLGMASGRSGAGTVNVTVELYDFNEPVSVQVPDPSRVGELGAGLLGN